MKHLIASLRAILVLTLLTSVGYPLLITAIGQAAFPDRVSGSLMASSGRNVGSELLAQKFTDERYFHPRPSAADYGTVASGASNQGYTSRKLQDAIAERRATWGANAPAELLTASGSGLDPHLSPEAARFQAQRVARSRGIPVEEIVSLIDRQT